MPARSLTKHVPTGGLDASPSAFGPHPFNVTSLKEGRLSVVKRNSRFCVSKYTNAVEFRNLTRASKWLKGAGGFKGNTSGGNVTVAVPRIENWDAKQGLLVMELCAGKNVETELIGGSARRQFYVALLSDLLLWIRTKSFYWKNFAPRNVLYDDSTDTVYLVDFESPLRIGRRRMSKRSFGIYCQDNVILELSAVLFKREQDVVCPAIWENWRSGSVRLAHIEGRRKRRFIQLHHPGKRLITYAEFVQIQQRIVAIATPFPYNGSIFYPLHALSRITELNLYVNTVLELERQAKKWWPSIIKNSLTAAPN